MAAVRPPIPPPAMRTRTLFIVYPLLASLIRGRRKVHEELGAWHRGEGCISSFVQEGCKRTEPPRPAMNVHQTEAAEAVGFS
jgi:hypothetical protein